MAKKQQYIKSPMNYTGGKYKLLPQIIPLFPTGNIRYFIDMFTGGANIAVNIKNADKIIANDFDYNVISIYNAFKSNTIDEILNHINGRINEYGLSIDNQDGFNMFRSVYNATACKNYLDLFVLICYSFNHQIRFNKDGDFNMPFGKNRSQFNDSIKNNLILFREAIENIVFTCKSFEDIKLGKLNENDFIYCDPPYLITCATYNEKDGWNEENERKLLEILDEINKRNVKFALSNVLTNKGMTNEILLEWSKKYNVHHLSNTYSNCSYHAKDRSTDTTDEVLITNY